MKILPPGANLKLSAEVYIGFQPIESTSSFPTSLPLSRDEEKDLGNEAVGSITSSRA